MTEAPNADSPLLSVNNDALTALFEADPLTLTDADLMRLVSELRRRRSVFASEEAAKALAGKKTRGVKADPATPTTALTSDKPTSELSLDDI